MPRRERTVFDGLEPNDELSPRVVVVTDELIDMYEEALAKFDDDMARIAKTRAACIRLIKEARKKLRAGK